MNQVLTTLAISLFLGLAAGQHLRSLPPCPLRSRPAKSSPVVPGLNEDRYWGPGDASKYKEDKTIRPFKVSFTKEIEDLKVALSKPLDHFQAPLEGTKGFERGFNSNELKKLVKFWRDDYLKRWSERQAYLNRFPQFKTQINGLKVHFIHLKPKLTAAQRRSTIVLPLLLLHGWPSSVRDFYEIIPMLTTPNSKSRFVFEIVAPSLPGFGWSEGASKQGLGASGAAVIFKKLMSRLDHKQFVILGGDWGGLITSQIATLYPKNVLGAHSSICVALSGKSLVKMGIASLFPQFFLTPEQMPFHFPLKDKLVNGIFETGFFHMHATKPDTMGAMLTNNPIGLLAYFLEKFSTWTNLDYKYLADGGLQKKFSLDSLLDNIMIYHLSNSITTSVRIYFENFNKPERDLKIEGIPTNVPYGCARFKQDLFHMLDWQLTEKFTNLVHSTYIQDGGHFPVLEAPEVVYKDFMEFVRKVATYSKPVSTRPHDVMYQNFMNLVKRVLTTLSGQGNLSKSLGVPEAIFNNFMGLGKQIFGSLAGEL